MPQMSKSLHIFCLFSSSLSLSNKDNKIIIFPYGILQTYASWGILLTASYSLIQVDIFIHVQISNACLFVFRIIAIYTFIKEVQLLLLSSAVSFRSEC